MLMRTCCWLCKVHRAMYACRYLHWCHFLMGVVNLTVTFPVYMQQMCAHVLTLFLRASRESNSSLASLTWMCLGTSGMTNARMNLKARRICCNKQKKTSFKHSFRFICNYKHVLITPQIYIYFFMICLTSHTFQAFNGKPFIIMWTSLDKQRHVKSKGNLFQSYWMAGWTL